MYHTEPYRIALRMVANSPATLPTIFRYYLVQKRMQTSANDKLPVCCIQMPNAKEY